MKITGFSSSAVRGASVALPTHTRIELHCDNGLTGIAIARGDVRAAVAPLCETVLLGEDPRGVAGLWQRISAAPAADAGPSHRAALASLDIALWDLKARSHDEPLWRTLGGSPPRAKAHACLAATDISVADLAARCVRLREQLGIRSVQLRAGGDPTVDLERLEAVRRALKTDADEPILAIDFCGSGTATDCIAALQRIHKRVDLTWAREPVAANDAAGLAQVSEVVRAAVCAGGTLGSVADFRPLFEQRSVDVVEINLAALGITAALQLADCAFGYELPVILSAVPGDIQLHLASVMPYLMSVEVNCPDEAAMQVPGAGRILDGWATVGTAVGNGLVSELSPAAANALDETATAVQERRR